MSRETDSATEREYLLDRLHNLRTILPVFAQELATARRQTTRLKADNARLAEQVRQLQRLRGPAQAPVVDGRARGAQRRRDAPGKVAAVR